MPDRLSILQSAKAIISEKLGVEESEVKLEAKLVEDLGADSLDEVEIVMAMEEELATEIPDEMAEKIRTVGDLVRIATEQKK